MDDLEKLLATEASTTPPISASNNAPLRQHLRSLLDKDLDQRLPLFLTSVVISQGLTYLITENPHWPAPITLNLSVAIYIAVLYAFFFVYDISINFFNEKVLGIGGRPNILVEFCKFFLTLFSAGHYQYYFIYEPVFDYSRPSSLSIILMTTALYSAVAAAIYYRFRQMKDIALKSKVAQAETQYSMLESQMQPHFLFNSLNVLSELIYVDPDLANSMTQKLADLYREILHNSKAKFSTLESEISILNKYVEIQKIRFGERIEFNVDVSPAFLNIKIPSLILQTLVENAIKHGISPKKEGGVIELSVRKKGSQFEVCISNTGAPYTGHQASSRSTGLENTKHRLELTYGQMSAFQIYSENNRTYVKFNITGRTK
jgi:sensor histidine kinase YesM